MSSRRRLARFRVAAVVVAVTLLGTVGPGLARSLETRSGRSSDTATLAAGSTSPTTPVRPPTATPTATPTHTPTQAPAATTTPAAPLAPATVVVPLPPASSRACRSGLVALTFDDGPAPGTTARLVGLLTKERVPATFFMVGSRVRQHPELARLVQRAGFGVGNHTYTHADLVHLSAHGVRSQLTSTAAELRKAGVRPGPLMRPPYGATDGTVTGVAHSLHLAPTLWSIDSLDWSRGTPPQIAQRVLARLHPHQVNLVLQHDGVVRSPLSVAAVPAIITGARRHGYCFASLDDHGRPAAPVPTASLTASYGTTSGRPLEVRVALSGPTSRPVSVRVRTVGGAAVPGSAVPGADVAAIDRVVTFPVGATTALVRLPVTIRQQSPLGLPTIQVQVSGATGLRLPDTTIRAQLGPALAVPTLTP